MKANLFRVALACATVAMLTACSSGADEPPVPQPSPSADTCKDAVVEGCHQITAGGKQYRYYLNGQLDQSRTVLLVDLGGPGVSLGSVLPPDYGVTFRQDLGALAEGKALLLIEEPWVNGTGDATCGTTSAQFYSWMRSNWSQPADAAAPRIQCPWGQGIYGWNRDTYRAVVQSIIEEQHVTTIDMAALSFGAVRYSYIDDLVGTATLVRPAAAPGTPSAEVTSARAAQIWKSLVTRCAGCTSASVQGVAAKTITGYAGRITELPDRSIPVTDFDIASALVAAGINTTDEPDLRWQASAGTVDPAAAAKLSDALWLRIGTESVSPGLIAYMDEYCQAYPADNDPENIADPVRTILAGPLRCDPAAFHSAPAPEPVDCLIAGTADASAPAALAQTWTVAETGRRGTSADRRHWFTDLAVCRG